MKILILISLFLFSNDICHAQKKNISDISILYNIDEFKLTQTQIQKINLFLNKLDSVYTYSVQIISSADYLGTLSYNNVLACKRAKEIEKTLFSLKPTLIKRIRAINNGEIVEPEKEKLKIKTGNQQNRKTKIIFNKIISNNKKVYIYNPIRQEFYVDIGKKFTLKNLLFYRGTTKMYPKSKKSLNHLLRFLKENPNIEIEIQGHLCCNAGDYQPDKSKIIAYNELHLSTRRARLVYVYLVKNGINKKRLIYHGFGFQSPIIYPETSKKDKSINKRVEIVITKY